MAPTYGQVMEEQLARGKTTEKAHKIASSPLMRKSDKFDKSSWLDKAILKRLRRKKKSKEAKEKAKPLKLTYEKWLRSK